MPAHSTTAPATPLRAILLGTAVLLLLAVVARLLLPEQLARVLSMLVIGVGAVMTVAPWLAPDRLPARTAVPVSLFGIALAVMAWSDMTARAPWIARVATLVALCAALMTIRALRPARA